MQYAVNIPDMLIHDERIKIVLQILLGPVTPNQKVMRLPKGCDRLDEFGVVLETDEKRAKAILELLRKTIEPEHRLLRFYESRDGEHWHPLAFSLPRMTFNPPCPNCQTEMTGLGLCSNPRGGPISTLYRCGKCKKHFRKVKSTIKKWSIPIAAAATKAGVIAGLEKVIDVIKGEPGHHRVWTAFLGASVDVVSTPGGQDLLRSVGKGVGGGTSTLLSETGKGVHELIGKEGIGGRIGK